MVEKYIDVFLLDCLDLLQPSTFKFGHPCLSGPRSYLATSEDFQDVISHWLVSDLKPLSPITSDLSTF